ncbi:uncharacterized protein NDAI_0F01910 [Naumovozyma dairenensis CBS 421]|uniref:Uncharacterized protein n=1 Tax=Naumovozyma dairenensis (strain ATCC 10597 / BCRC 20456 / CBS 421 / NBRC 0211 / NRRL Y-12639) TaxID=1071378 RepID=G0WCJ8_NAUDC|nr:hypothetical protein NDAI_0F01910 [Naumovozyma dairenensis CBS 421]CCD25509.1 hypothetical protein NDAI_0F01910 [Naumovozyma dairenensis CBS 421]
MVTIKTSILFVKIVGSIKEHIKMSSAHGQRSYLTDTLPHKIPNINQTSYSSPPQWNQPKSQTRFSKTRRPRFTNNSKPHRNFKHVSKRRSYQNSSRNQSNQRNTRYKGSSNISGQGHDNATSKAPKPGVHQVQHIEEEEQPTSGPSVIPPHNLHHFEMNSKKCR